jgi:hypothetical protein
MRGIDVGDPRLPLPPATSDQAEAIVDDLAEAGVPLASHEVRTGTDDTTQVAGIGRGTELTIP